jgi:DNA-directed RNA polymerase specialized sigma24 family protein
MTAPSDPDPAAAWERLDVWGKLVLVLTRASLAQRVLSPPDGPRPAPALTALLEDLRRALQRIAGRFTRSDAAEEIGQDVLTRIWNACFAPVVPSPAGPARWPTFEERPIPYQLRPDFTARDLRFYVRRMVRNEVRDRLRRDANRHTTALVDEPAAPPVAASTDAAALERTQREDFESTLNDLIARAAERGNTLVLSANDRELLWLRYSVTPKVTLLARHLGQKYSTTAQNLRRLRLRIQDALGIDPTAAQGSEE